MSGYKWSERLLRTRAQVQSLISGNNLNYPGFYIISDAVTATKQIRVDVTSINTISDSAINITDGTFGTYDLGADTFTVGNTLQLVTDASAGGTGAGVASTTHELDVMGMRVFGDTDDDLQFLGLDAGTGNTGSDVLGVGASAAQDNTGNSVTAFGIGAAINNTATSVTAVGLSSASGNSGTFLTALGASAGASNTFNNVIAIGGNAVPTAANQIAFNDGAGHPLTINLIAQQGSDMAWYLKVETVAGGVGYVKMLAALP